jgi:glyoxylase-like metal-dependent hydrolase (beta-lactamase superfamily II)
VNPENVLRTVDKWFRRKSVGDGITLIDEPYVHPFLRCNIWHVAGRSVNLLVDTGLGIASLRDEIQDLNDKPLTVVATHIHYDHVGSLHEFEHRVMHPIEAPRMEDYREPAPLHSAVFAAAYADYFVEPGYEEYLISAKPLDSFRIEAFTIRSTLVSATVSDGDIIDLGDRHFEILHLPGHSPGSIGLWEKATGTLFSGDAIYNGILLDDLADSKISDYIDTMRRLRELPVSVVHGGHEPSFGRDRYLQLIDQYLAARDI